MKIIQQVILLLTLGLFTGVAFSQAGTQPNLAKTEGPVRKGDLKYIIEVPVEVQNYSSIRVEKNPISAKYPNFRSNRNLNAQTLCAAPFKNSEIDVKTNSVVKFDHLKRPTQCATFDMYGTNGVSNTLLTKLIFTLNMTIKERSEYPSYAVFFKNVLEGNKISDADLIKAGIDTQKSRLLSYGSL